MNLSPQSLQVLVDIKRALLFPSQRAASNTNEDMEIESKPSKHGAAGPMRHARVKNRPFQRACQKREFWGPTW